MPDQPISLCVGYFFVLIYWAVFICYSAPLE
jgi:hypothetical protein